MALTLLCKTSGTIAYADCSCPDGYDPHNGGHLDKCQMSNLGAQVQCPPTAGCCQEDHDHDEQATCPGGHTACPEPAACELWTNVRSHHEDPDAAGLPATCPGGHCGVNVPGCTVCHPITIILPPGHMSGSLKRAAG
ncbi:MAG TPA: hypothetical protein VKU39_05225 [Streptosporangiaceae bacterium]|nr:hypothetical protein [Streptosporangiaceae bacterium]